MDNAPESLPALEDKVFLRDVSYTGNGLFSGFVVSSIDQISALIISTGGERIRDAIEALDGMHLMLDSEREKLETVAASAEPNAPRVTPAELADAEGDVPRTFTIQDIRLLVERFAPESGSGPAQPDRTPTEIVQEAFTDMRINPQTRNVVGFAPTAQDDETAGYNPLDQWLDESTKDVYILVDNTPGAAVWKLITLS